LIFLITASFVFYGWWSPIYLVLILASGLIDFLCGLAIGAWPAKKKWFLLLSILGNWGILASFKYSVFFATSLFSFLSWAGLETEHSGTLSNFFVILPVGISFYTFQSLSYTIDVYRGLLTPTKNPLKFFAYLSLFPQLVAGPIVRARTLLPQMNEIRSVSAKQCWDGLVLVVFGYFKKVVIADNLAPYIDVAFASADVYPSSIYWWLIAGMFAIQIYADFSGYSDIARGLGKWMGFEFPLNFNRPYISRSLREFWTRWHISLSTWFRDYVYVPLGGSKVNTVRSHLNMWTAMLVSGLWHGASWTFVFWGAFHAAILSLERITQWPNRLAKRKGGKGFSILVVLLLVCTGWVLFRAESISQAGEILKTMFSLHWNDLNFFPAKIGLVPLGILVLFALKEFAHQSLDRRVEIKEILLHSRAAQVTLILAALGCFFLRGPGQQFIYFQF